MVRESMDNFPGHPVAGSLRALGRECAWCGVGASESAVAFQVARVSHVICDGCLEEQLRVLREGVPSAA